MLAAGGQCGDVVGKLEGRGELVGLAEGGPGGLVVARLIAGQGTGVITNLNAGVLSQAEGLQILPEGVHEPSVIFIRAVTRIYFIIIGNSISMIRSKRHIIFHHHLSTVSVSPKMHHLY